MHCIPNYQLLISKLSPASNDLQNIIECAFTMKGGTDRILQCQDQALARSRVEIASLMTFTGLLIPYTDVFMYYYPFGFAYIAQLFPSKDLHAATVYNLQQNTWIDAQTRAVDLSFNLYNPTFDLVASVQAHCAWPVTGHVKCNKYELILCLKRSHLRGKTWPEHNKFVHYCIGTYGSCRLNCLSPGSGWQV